MSGESGIGRSAARAAIWAFVATAGARVITLVGLTILARILAPGEFGLLAFAMVYITYAETIGDLGTGMALVYWPDRREEAAQVTFIINVVAGIFWCVFTILLAPWIAHFFNGPSGVGIIRILSLSFIVRYLGNTHDALAQKDLRFRARAVPEMGKTAVKAVISIVLASLGFGAWSLVWGQIAGTALWTILLWCVVDWRPTLQIPRDLFKPMLRYGRGIIAVNVISSIIYYIDLAVVGRAFSPTVLGLYQMASKVPETTVVLILWIVSRVLFPLFSRLHAEGQNLAEPYLAATRYVAALTLPAAIGLFFVAEPVVLVFFGTQWAPAAPILKAFAIYVGVRSFDHHSGDVIKAIGRANLLAALNFVKAGLVVTGVLIASRISPVAVAGSLSIVYAIGTVVTLITVSRLLKVRVMAIAAAFASAAKAGAFMTGALLVWNRLAPPMPPILTLAANIFVGAAAYLGALRFFDRDMFEAALDSVFGRSSTAAEELLRATAP